MQHGRTHSPFFCVRPTSSRVRVPSYLRARWSDRLKVRPTEVGVSPTDFLSLLALYRAVRWFLPPYFNFNFIFPRFTQEDAGRSGPTDFPLLLSPRIPRSPPHKTITLKDLTARVFLPIYAGQKVDQVRPTFVKLYAGQKLRWSAFWIRPSLLL